MVGLIIFLIASFSWMAFEIWRAPMMDENGNIIKKGNKLSDIFKRNKS